MHLRDQPRIVKVQYRPKERKKNTKKKSIWGVTLFVDGQAGPLVQQAVLVSVFGHLLPSIVGELP